MGVKPTLLVDDSGWCSFCNVWAIDLGELTSLQADRVLFALAGM